MSKNFTARANTNISLPTPVLLQSVSTVNGGPPAGGVTRSDMMGQFTDPNHMQMNWFDLETKCH